MQKPPAPALLCVFARAPEPGRVKTRLGLDGQAAAALHLALCDDTCRLTRGLAARRQLAVASDATDRSLVALAEREGMDVMAQRGEDLGERLHAAIDEGLRDGADRVVVIGSDAPHAPPALIAEALAALDKVDCVLGPAEDGGYWLVGARRPLPTLFAGIAWGTDAVLAQSLERLAAAGASWRLVGGCWDVDTPADLARLARLLVDDPAGAPATYAALAELGIL